MFFLFSDGASEATAEGLLQVATALERLVELLRWMAMENS